MKFCVHVHEVHEESSVCRTQQVIDFIIESVSNNLRTPSNYNGDNNEKITTCSLSTQVYKMVPVAKCWE